MQVVLVMFRADGERRSFSVARDMTVIGRREDCDLRIPLGDVSRKHCRILKDDQAVRVQDLGSSNGTYHNGVRVQEATLGAGDALRVGNVEFVVQIDGVPAEEEMQTPAAVRPAAPDDTAAELAAMAAQAGTPTALDEGGFADLAAPHASAPTDDFVIDDEAPAPEEDDSIDLPPVSHRPASPLAPAPRADDGAGHEPAAAGGSEDAEFEFDLDEALSDPESEGSALDFDPNTEEQHHRGKNA